MQINRAFPGKKIALSAIFIVIIFTPAFAGPGDFNIDGTYEAALDLPRILFLLKRDPNGPALDYLGDFVPVMAFLDTGASGILLSKETAEALGVSTHPTAQYADIGVGGIEFFDISEPLYIAVNTLDDPSYDNPDHYHLLSGPWRFQVSKDYAPWYSEAIDILGVPMMAGKVIVLDARGPSNLDYFMADIKEPNDAAIPSADFNVPLRFEKYITPSNPNNIPPLPILAYNPVIDNVTIEYNGSASTGTWLFDTGATISLISTNQGQVLGLVDSNSNPLITPDFYVPLGGIGGSVDVPGFQIDSLTVPTLAGYNMVFENARIGVHDIGFTDEDTGQQIILDGIFGSNFLCATMNLDTWNLADTPFYRIIIDMEKAILGFDVLGIYQLPICGDAYHTKPAGDITNDCRVNYYDIFALNENWLRNDCNSGNDFCNSADMNQNGSVDVEDYVLLANHWRESAFLKTCGDIDHPWPEGDFNRDCRVDMHDLQILAREWLNSCDALNWNCRGTDLYRDGSSNLKDYSEFADNFNE